MRNLTVFLFAALLLFSCGTSRRATVDSPVTTSAEIVGDRDGSSFDKAVVINEKSETNGVAAEYEWLRKNYPGCTLKSQSLNYNDKKPYDILSIVTAEGQKKDVYFDISKFFGKM